MGTASESRGPDGLPEWPGRPGRTAELTGRTALITGAGRGIGRACALELARMGADVVLTGRTAVHLEAAASAVRAVGVRASVLVADLREPHFPDRLADVAPIDVLVHNAAAFAPYAPVEQLPAADIERVLDTILRAPIALTQRVVGGMKERGFGRVVAIGTIAAEAGASGQTAYSAAKAGLTGFIRSVAAESARHGVTCNLVQPGLIDTERVRERIEPEWQRRILAGVAMGRAGTAEEVASVVGFLCSPRAAYVTGASIPVSGGFGVGLYARDVPE